HVMREQQQRGGCIGRLDGPPDLVATLSAGADGPPMTQRADKALPRSDRNRAFLGLVAVAEDVFRHLLSLAKIPQLRYGEIPWFCPEGSLKSALVGLGGGPAVDDQLERVGHMPLMREHHRATAPVVVDLLDVQ